MKHPYMCVGSPSGIPDDWAVCVLDPVIPLDLWSGGYYGPSRAHAGRLGSGQRQATWAGSHEALIHIC
jgi:hypothetical protein